MLSCPSRLHTVNLAGNYLEDAGGLAIAAGMVPNVSVTHLDLRDCAIQEHGIQAVLKATRRSMRLKTLLLSRNTCEASIESEVSPKITVRVRDTVRP